jgi:putative ABC transport system substrate-binding protein
VVARAQQQATPVVGLLGAGAAQGWAAQVAAVRKGLRELGFIEGQNLAIEYRWAEDQYDRLPALADDLVSRRVAVIVTVSGTPAALAAKAATTTIPVVFALGGDPVRSQRTPGSVSRCRASGGRVPGFAETAPRRDINPREWRPSSGIPIAIPRMVLVESVAAMP